MIQRTAAAPDGYENLLVGAGTHDIIIRTAARKMIEKRASQKQRAELEAIVRRYASGGPSELPRSKFNGNEGWFPSAAASPKIMLQAFKPWQLRAYGFCRTFNGRPTFFITAIDPAKKQDRADPRILKAAGDEAVQLDRALRA